MREMNLFEEKVTEGGFWVIQLNNGEYFQDMKPWGEIISTKDFRYAYKFFIYIQDIVITVYIN